MNSPEASFEIDVDTLNNQPETTTTQELQGTPELERKEEESHLTPGAEDSNAKEQSAEKLAVSEGSDSKEKKDSTKATTDSSQEGFRVV